MSTRSKFYLMLFVPLIPMGAMTAWASNEFDARESECNTYVMSPLAAQASLDKKQAAADEVEQLVAGIHSSSSGTLSAEKLDEVVRLKDAEIAATHEASAAALRDAREGQGLCDLSDQLSTIESVASALVLYLLALLGSAVMVIGRRSNQRGARRASRHTVALATVMGLSAGSIWAGWVLLDGMSSSFLVMSFGVVTTAMLTLVTFECPSSGPADG